MKFLDKFKILHKISFVLETSIQLTLHLTLVDKLIQALGNEEYVLFWACSWIFPRILI